MNNSTSFSNKDKAKTGKVVKYKFTLSVNDDHWRSLIYDVEIISKTHNTYVVQMLMWSVFLWYTSKKLVRVPELKRYRKIKLCSIWIRRINFKSKATRYNVTERFRYETIERGQLRVLTGAFYCASVLLWNMRLRDSAYKRKNAVVV